MQLTLQADIGDGPFTVTTSLWAITQWERKFKSKASQLAEGIGVEDLGYLAYESAKQNGIVVPAVFDDFMRNLRSIDVIEQDSPRPTSGEPSDTH